MTTQISTRKITTADIPGCEAVLRQLPEWFGQEDSNIEYIENLKKLDACVAETDGEIIGFAGLSRYGDFAIEIEVICVQPDRHHQGIGRKLVSFIERSLTTSSTKLLHMKTIAPTSTDPNYAETRKFWQGIGFIPMEAVDLWDENNPCLIMVKPL